MPNYYYKVLLKVKRTAGEVTSASTIGFFLPHHTEYATPKSDYNKYVYSVDQIEEWTGFDFFANLPDSVEASAESNISTATFSNFR